MEDIVEPTLKTTDDHLNQTTSIKTLFIDSRVVAFLTNIFRVEKQSRPL